MEKVERKGIEGQAVPFICPKLHLLIENILMNIYLTFLEPSSHPATCFKELMGRLDWLTLFLVSVSKLLSSAQARAFIILCNILNF